MKKLGKLSINPEKMIRNNELVNLKGGYGTGCCGCMSGINLVGSTASECYSDCMDLTGFPGRWWCV